MRIGVFGGTFNPVHYGHLRAAEEVRESLGLERILFVPAGVPPLKSSELEAVKHRYSMTELAIASNRFFEISDIECKKSERSYSVDTVQELKALYPDSELFFILGTDAFMDLPNWRQPEKLTALVDFVIIARPSCVFADIANSPYLEVKKDVLLKLDQGIIDSYNATLKSGRTAVLLRITPMAVSATHIRALLQKNKSVKYLLPESVESYIISHGLYTKTGQ